ncbi:hypothetical protein TNCV_1367451 [Trichonephila clavipes]|nr:hypothetical protein TNCV_1367451 [Trichonephila clavipes]
MKITIECWVANIETLRSTGLSYILSSLHPKSIWILSDIQSVIQHLLNRSSIDSNCLTYRELFSARKHIDKKDLARTPVHTWYRADSPRGSLAMNCDRCTQTAVARFLRGHLRSLAF